jgi:predicted O-methyltransferase YrrM
MNELSQQGAAQTLAGRAVLLEIGAKLGVLDPLLTSEEISVADVASRSGVKASLVSAYYLALAQAGLTIPRKDAAGVVTRYSASNEMKKAVNDAGYVLWGVMSCAPLISNAMAFADDLTSAARDHVRDGEHVARTSKWMGEQDFYPHAERAILAARPKKIVDLGSGTCGLLMRCLRKLPDATAVGIDINADACAKASSIIQANELSHRIQVIQAPIQSLIDDPTPVEGADVIHGGFVFHDLMPDEEATLDALLRTFCKRARGTLVVVDAVPYGQNPGEEAFSAAFTFLHNHFMGRQLMTESQWKAKLLSAGYDTVDVSRLGISGGRIFTARTSRI